MGNSLKDLKAEFGARFTLDPDAMHHGERVLYANMVADVPVTDQRLAALRNALDTLPASTGAQRVEVPNAPLVTLKARFAEHFGLDTDRMDHQAMQLYVLLTSGRRFDHLEMSRLNTRLDVLIAGNTEPESK